jgi:hypothetical protein
MRAASMPMYDMPETRAALDSLSAGLARNLRAEGVREVPDLPSSTAARSTNSGGSLPAV